MPYLILFLGRMWWLVSSFIGLHLHILSTYFFCLTVWLAGDRVSVLAVESESYTVYMKGRAEEHMIDVDGEDSEADSELPGGDDGTAA